MIKSGASASGAHKPKAAQRAFELRQTWSDALEVLTGERDKPHRRARHDSGSPLSRQDECDLAERVAGTERLGRLASVGQDIGLSLFDEVDGGSVVVDRGDLGTRLNLDLPHRGREFVELIRRKISQDRKCCDPTALHGRGSFRIGRSSARNARVKATYLATPSLDACYTRASGRNKLAGPERSPAALDHRARNLNG